MSRRLLAFVLPALLLGAAGTARAQGVGTYIGSLNWNVSLPMGDTKDFIGNTSYLGFTLDGDRFIRDKISVGFTFGWQEIYEETAGTFQLESGAITGTQYRHLMYLPFLVHGRWYPTGTGRITPFLGVGTGAYFIKQDLEVGIYGAIEDEWHFAVAPEAGIHIPFERGIGVTLQARYNLPLSSGPYLGGDNKAWDNVALQLGLMWFR